MSVAIGMPQPLPRPVPTVINAKRTAGTIIPPSAAAIGTIAAHGSRSSPTAISRLISSPTTKKKIVIRPSLTHASRVSACAGPGRESVVLQRS